MTTLQEISICEKANYDFWTVRAKTNLVSFKSTGCSLARSGFRSCIWHRRMKTYFRDNIKNYKDRGKKKSIHIK